MSEPLVELAEEITRARTALLATARVQRWRAYALKDRVHASTDLTSGAVNIAFRRLVRDGAFQLDGDLVSPSEQTDDQLEEGAP